MIKKFTFCLAVFTVFSAFAAETFPLFSDDLSFYQSFNSGQNADICNGSERPVSRLGKPKFLPGLRGNALLCGSGGGAYRYKRTDNLNFDTPGTVVFFYKPIDWEIDRAKKLPRCLFWAIESNKGYIGLQGGNDPKHLCMCERQFHLMLIYGKRLPDKSFFLTPVEKKRCENWHMFAVAWAGDKMFMKFDRELTKQFEFPPMLKDSDFPADNFSVGTSLSWKYLMDEFMIYSRKLSDDELNSLFDAAMKK